MGDGVWFLDDVMKPKKPIKDDGYDQIYDGQWVAAPEYLACCDCGLVHRLKYRIRKGRLEMQMFRDKAETRNCRRCL